jgi:hypothetical protein
LQFDATSACSICKVEPAPGRPSLRDDAGISEEAGPRSCFADIAAVFQARGLISFPIHLASTHGDEAAIINNTNPTENKTTLLLPKTQAWR